MLGFAVPFTVAVLAIAVIVLTGPHRRRRVTRVVQTAVIVACFIQSALMGSLPARSLGEFAWDAVLGICWGVLAAGSVVLLERFSGELTDERARLSRHLSAHRPASTRRRVGGRPNRRVTGTVATHTKEDC